RAAHRRPSPCGSAPRRAGSGPLQSGLETAAFVAPPRRGADLTRTTPARRVGPLRRLCPAGRGATVIRSFEDRMAARPTDSFAAHAVLVIAVPLAFLLSAASAGVASLGAPEPDARGEARSPIDLEIGEVTFDEPGDDVP